MLGAFLAWQARVVWKATLLGFVHHLLFLGCMPAGVDPERSALGKRLPPGKAFHKKIFLAVLAVEGSTIRDPRRMRRKAYDLM
jgi:hypothetical protein